MPAPRPVRPLSAPCLIIRTLATDIGHKLSRRIPDKMP